MSVTTERRTMTVALLGNPNTGKSTLFNGLVGVRQRVGNYPGVTVEKKVGRLEIAGRLFDLIDLPGTYSLAPRSPDEMIAVEVLLGRQTDVAPPDAVLCIVDSSNLERNLYLVSQVLELGIPTIIALNMMDVAASRGITIDVARLQQQLGVPVVPTRANHRQGLTELKAGLAGALPNQVAPSPKPFPEPFSAEVDALQACIERRGGGVLPRYLVERLLLDTGYLAQAGLPGVTPEVLQELHAARQRLESAGIPLPAVEAIARYQWVGQVLSGVIQRAAQPGLSRSDRLDRVLTHRVWGTLIFAALMVLVFQAVFRWAVPVMEWIDGGVSALGDAAAAWLPEGAVRSLLVDGVIAGAGGVLVFLPQIFVLFFFIAVLEDCGYMARAAYLMDRLMVRVGLSGKSFIPLLSSFACAIPGILAARVIEDRRDRLATMLVAPLMSCSARLPVYVLLIAAFIPPRHFLGGWVGLQGMTLLAMYGVGLLTAVLMALCLKRTLLRGATPPFVMELPPYKLPCARNVVYRMVDRGWAFVRRAGTLIVAVTVLVWAAAYYPHDAAEVETPYRAELARLDAELAALRDEPAGRAEPGPPRREVLEQQRDDLRNRVAGAYLHQSYLGRAGRWLEPLVRPLGWDWRVGCAVIASFPAREVVIGTLGVIYNLGAGQDEQSAPLRQRLREATWDDSGQPVFNVPVALSLMVFFALCAQCASTLVVMRRETNGWRWPAFTFCYMTGLAYVGALLVYQGARLLTGGDG